MLAMFCAIFIKENMEMSRKSVMIDEDIHRKAKILAAQTGLTIGDIVELLLEGTSEKEILKLAEKKQK